MALLRGSWAKYNKRLNVAILQDMCCKNRECVGLCCKVTIVNVLIAVIQVYDIDNYLTLHDLVAFAESF